MQLGPGKLVNRPLSPVAAGNSSSTLYLLDNSSNTRFLVDSGEEVSLIPPSLAERKGNGQGPSLVAANGSSIRSFGSRRLQLQFKGRVLSWTFVVADVPGGIIGADFLRHHSLMVDLRSKCLVDSTNLSVIQCFSAPSSTQRISFVQPSDCPFMQLLRDRPALTTPAFDRVQPTHGVELHIETSGPPVFARPRRLAPEKLAAARKEFELMEKLGILRKSSSPWSSPLHIVCKKDGGFQPCGDLQQLNNMTTPDRYPIPYLSDAT